MDRNGGGWRRKARRIGLGLAVAAAFTAAACGDDDDPTGPSGPEQVPESELVFLRQAVEAPALATDDTTFVATFGEELDVELGYANGEDFLDFELDAGSLFAYPAGHPLAGRRFGPGDTITIRITVDPELLLASFEPTGLRFNPLEPAELEIRYLNAEEDTDDDGIDDLPEREGEIDLWRQESPGDPWERVGDIKDAELDRIRARIETFSRYALAF